MSHGPVGGGRGGEGRTREEGVSGDEEGMGKSMRMDGGGEGWA